MAESGHSILPIFGHLSGRFGEKRTSADGEGAELAGLCYRKRICVWTVGTVQITPRYQNEMGLPSLTKSISSVRCQINSRIFSCHQVGHDAPCFRPGAQPDMMMAEGENDVSSTRQPADDRQGIR